ncbi:hypothetical protein [Clostridium sp. OS1-26]|nr:hypothetical protein [Clostridium sp. OS1-26]WML35650.1 hypothetical protein RCG18_02540 [Clostridium sp. OS1-26]
MIKISPVTWAYFHAKETPAIIVGAINNLTISQWNFITAANSPTFF